MNWSDLRIILLSVLGSAICVAYFQTLDLMGFSSAHFAPIFQVLLTVYDAQTAFLTVVVCVSAAFWRNPEPILRMVDGLAVHPLRVVCTTVVLLALAAVFVYMRYPLSMDEYAAVFQSKIFAHGDIVAELPPSAVDWLVVPGFNGSFLLASRETGRAIEEYWPGFALLLAPFQLVSAPWLCNPLLAGLAIYLIYSITLEITGNRRSAVWSMLFALASTAFLANAISYYSMQAHLTLNLLFAWLLLKPSTTRACIAGAVGSMALVLHNPVPHALFALPWILGIALSKEQRRFLIPLAAGYLPISIALGCGWLYLRTTITGEASGAAVMSGTANAVLHLPDFTILNMRIAGLAKMWVWAVPGLYLLALAGRLRHGEDRRVRLLAYSAMVTFCGYFFVILDQGHGWGYRYFHGAFGVIPILAGCALTDRSESHSRLASFACAAVVLSLLVLVPFQANQIHGFISRHLAQLPPPRRPGNNVYFIQPGGGSYMADMIQIDPYLRAPDLLLASRGAVLDADLIRQNWPNAVKLRGGLWEEQWYLGPTDQRRSMPGKNDTQFNIAFDPAVLSRPHTTPDGSSR